VPYAVIDNIYALGLAARAFIAYAKPFEGVDPTTGTIRIKAHGYDPRDIITFEVSGGGTLPWPLSDFTPFHPLPLSSDLFQVASAVNGPPVAPFDSIGSAWAVCLDVIRRLNSHLADAAAIIDDNLTAHEVPIDPDENGQYPPVLVGMNARMAARAAVNTLQVENAQYKAAIDRLFATEKRDEEMLERWLKGKPIQPRPKPDPLNTKLDNLAFGRARRPPIPWNPGSL
jgi:hypothetical protein